MVVVFMAGRARPDVRAPARRGSAPLGKGRSFSKRVGFALSYTTSVDANDPARQLALVLAPGLRLSGLTGDLPRPPVDSGQHRGRATLSGLKVLSGLTALCLPVAGAKPWT
jgi:hypothetical protein